MGENEQGGMLRNVVVMGLIVIMISAIFGLLLTLKTHAHDSTAQAVNPPILTQSIQATADENKVISGQSFFGQNTVTILDSGDVHIQTPGANQPTYAVWTSPALTVPADATTFTLSATAKGTTKQYANAWLKFEDVNGRGISSSSYVTAIGTNEIVSDFRTRSISQNIPKGAVKYRLSMEARENSDVTYRDVSVKFN